VQARAALVVGEKQRATGSKLGRIENVGWEPGRQPGIGGGHAAIVRVVAEIRLNEGKAPGIGVAGEIRDLLAPAGCLLDLEPVDRHRVLTDACSRSIRTARV